MLSALLLALVVPVQPQISVSGGVDVQVHAPTVRFEAEPALMLISPGVMVVPNHDREVFFVGGYYWYNVSGAWFRTRSHHGGWVRVPTQRVPVAIIRLPRGKYRRFTGGRLVRGPGRAHARVVKRSAAPRKLRAVKKRSAKRRSVRVAKVGKQRKARVVKRRAVSRRTRVAKRNAAPRKARASRAGKPRKVRATSRVSKRRRKR